MIKTFDLYALRDQDVYEETVEQLQLLSYSGMKYFFWLCVIVEVAVFAILMGAFFVEAVQESSLQGKRKTAQPLLEGPKKSAATQREPSNKSPGTNDTAGDTKSKRPEGEMVEAEAQAESHKRPEKEVNTEPDSAVTAEQAAEEEEVDAETLQR